MKDGLYNRNVYWNKEVGKSVRNALSMPYTIAPTFHAYNKMAKLRLPKGCYTAMLHGSVIEAQVKNNKVVKIITRLPNRFRPTQDICAAILLEPSEITNKAVVKTIWTNNAWDKHDSINVNNYVKGK